MSQTAARAADVEKMKMQMMQVPCSRIIWPREICKVKLWFICPQAMNIKDPKELQRMAREYCKDMAVELTLPAYHRWGCKSTSKYPKVPKYLVNIAKTWLSSLPYRPTIGETSFTIGQTSFGLKFLSLYLYLIDKDKDTIGETSFWPKFPSFLLSGLPPRSADPSQRIGMRLTQCQPRTKLFR